LESGLVEDIPEEPIKTRFKGVRFLHTKKVPICDAEGNPQYLLGISEDITERKKDGEFRDALIAELEAKNRELERFSYTVSHDLKAPLITISGFLGLLEKGLGDQVSDQARDDMRRIGDAARRMQAMLDDLLELSRIGRVANPQEEVDLHDVAEDAVSMLAGRLRHAGVDVVVSPSFPKLVCDRVRILQVFQNLIDNAAKHMGPGPNRRIEVGCLPNEESAVCYVRDNGVGIDPKYQDEIFGLFRRLHECDDGTGIGLTIVKRIVEVHGGCIWVESALGKGASFYFAIPFQADPRVSMDPASGAVRLRPPAAAAGD
jgi:signal transduction histidine kinase